MPCPRNTSDPPVSTRSPLGPGETPGEQKDLTRDIGLYYIRATKGGNNSAVECNLAKVEVAGSNPVSRSMFKLNRKRSVHEDDSRTSLSCKLNAIYSGLDRMAA